MKVLLTGAFGNIGTGTLAELLKRGFWVTAFDLKTPASQKIARKLAKQFAGQFEVAWGDLRNQAEIEQVMVEQEVIIHLAAIIPPLSEANPELAYAVNVAGLHHLITAAQSRPDPPRLIYASSAALFGRTQHLPPPRTINDPIQPIDHYTHHKAEGETLIKNSGLTWTILRFGAALPLALLDKIDPIMFEIPLRDRIEIVHTYDVGLALANAVQTEAIWSRILLIGGGPRCQIYQRELMEKSLNALGIGMLPDEAFGNTPFHTDWLDTTESQRLLNYQRYTFDDHIQHLTVVFGYRRNLIRLFRPLVRYIILKKSPYWKHNHR